MWEVYWPDRVMTSGQGPTEVLQKVRNQQFYQYTTLDEFVEELLKRLEIWNGYQTSYFSHEQVLKSMAISRAITLYIDGEQYA